MPEPPSQQEALCRLRSELPARWPGSIELSPNAIKARFPEREELIAGWRVPNAIAEAPRDLMLFVDRQFPWSLPLVAYPEALNGITYPHVEVDGHFCLVPDSRPFDLPVGLDHVEQLFEFSEDMLRKGRARENVEDFLSEAHSYWSLIKPTLSALWLTVPAPPGHVLWSAMSQGRDWAVGPSKMALQDWASCAGRVAGDFEPCPVLRLDSPLRPQDYPLSMADLVAFLATAGAQALLATALARWSTRRMMPVMLVFSHGGHDVCLGAGFPAPADILLPGARRHGIPGFRKRGKLSAQALAIATVQFPHMRVTPIFREYLLARTTGMVPEEVTGAHVVIAGCGTVGAELAVQLAKAGVGRLTLIDPELFDWRNVGRHVLDGKAVGQAKAAALAALIKHSFPDSRVESHFCRWEELPQAGLNEVINADLFVSATGEAAANLHLDALVAAGEMPATVFAFLEAFACAGHAILQIPGSGRLADLTKANGVLKDPVLDLTQAPELPQEPSCGAFYQPYSALAALSSVATIGELVLDALMGRATESLHRVWVGSAEAASRSGAALSETWRERVKELGDNRRFDLPMPICD